MRKIEGLTLGFVARILPMKRAGYRVFILDGRKDDTGRLAASGYELRQILWAHPELKRCRVAMAEDYYGETILRVLGASTGPAAGNRRSSPNFFHPAGIASQPRR